MPTIKGHRRKGDLNGSIELAEDKVVSRYALEFVVLADNASQGPIAIRSTVGLPLVGLSTYAYQGESDLTAVCKRKTPRQDKKQARVWYVLCEFDNDPNSESQEDEQNQPGATNRPAVINWDSEYGEEVLYEDFSNPPKPILNPVGQPYDPPPTRRVIHPVLTIERYQSTFVPATIIAYVDHTNELAFYGAAPGHALMANIRARQVVEESQLLWLVTYKIRFAINNDGFKLKPLNQGSHYSTVAYTGDDTTLRPFLNGQVPYIGNLNADGTKAALGSPSYGSFEGYPSADFDDLTL